MSNLYRLPLIVFLMAAFGLSMLGAAGIAASWGDRTAAGVLLLDGIMMVVVTFMVGFALSTRPARTRIGQEFAELIAAYIVLPFFLALPIYSLRPEISVAEGYFEMMSMLTTTGATLFEDPADLQPILHFWRAFVAWMGGLIVLVAGLAIMAPLNLGGFEVSGIQREGRISDREGMTRVDIGERVIRLAGAITPIYAGFTGFLMIGLLAVGEAPLVAVCHAMSVLASSGVSPVGGLTGSQSGFFGELLLLLFLVFSITHRPYARLVSGQRPLQFTKDPELQAAAYIVGTVGLLLFLRHYVAAIDAGETDDLASTVRAFWGTLFTVVSFLTTNGLESADWGRAEDWAGLETGGLVLLSLALMGGGIATTAGGIKLLRVVALYNHGLNEMERLVHPSRVGGHGSSARRSRRVGAMVAWMFVMMFFLTLAVVFLGLSLTGVDFESALVMTVASISNTGPLLGAFGTDLETYQTISGEARWVLCMSMLLGRVEVLAVVAVLNPQFWRS